MKPPSDEVNLGELKALDMAELRRLWQAHVGRRTKPEDIPKAQTLLIRDLAWWVQQRSSNGMDAETQGLLNAAIRQAANQAVKTGKSSTPRSQPSKTSPRKKPQLAVGVTLVRQWRGKTYKVKVIEDEKGRKRYEFAGQVYRSLTLVATEITGAHWSGPRFFGLNKVRSTG